MASTVLAMYWDDEAEEWDKSTTSDPSSDSFAKDRQGNRHQRFSHIR
jgi:hypothetical protein